MSAVKQVLLVEDEPDQRELFILLLERPHCHVTAVPDAEAAVIKLAVQTYDLVVTDLCLPGMQGDALVRLIKERRHAAKVLVISNFIHGSKTAADCGADAYLPKLEYPQLAALVDSLLA